MKETAQKMETPKERNPESQKKKKKKRARQLVLMEMKGKRCLGWLLDLAISHSEGKGTRRTDQGRIRHISNKSVVFTNIWDEH